MNTSTELGEDADLATVQKWWCALTNKKRRWYSTQHYAFEEKDGLKMTLSEREVAVGAYAEIQRAKKS